MNKKFKSVDYYRIGKYAVAAIEHGDYTAMSNKDADVVKNFIDSLPANASFAWGNETFHGRDCLSGLLADCISLEVTVFN